MSSVDWTTAFVPGHIAVRVGKHPPVLLQGGNEIRNELDGYDDLCPNGRAHDVVVFGFLYFFVGERHHLAEGKREVEGCVRNRTEVRVRSSGRSIILGGED